VNHRRGLYDMILIKENHVAAAGGVAAALRAARAHRPDLKIEIEVRDARELAEALGEAPDRVMLDNFTPEAIREAVAAVAATDPRPEIEVSGGVTPATVRDYALPGVDFISSGSITHSARALDLSMLITAGTDP
jgi:nicotinate-nucleotide pyrophosphorylase (carboxylating)